MKQSQVLGVGVRSGEADFSYLSRRILEIHSRKFCLAMIVSFSLTTAGIWTATCSFQYNHNCIRLAKSSLKTKSDKFCQGMVLLVWRGSTSQHCGLLTIWRLTATVWVVPHSQPPDATVYIFIQQIYVLNILNMLHNLRFFSLQNAVYFIMLTFLVPVLFTF